MGKIKGLKFNYKDMITLTESMLSRLSYFKINEEEQGPIEAKFDAGNTKLVLITGENATGKSFVRRLYCGAIKKSGVEVIHLSQEGRSSGGIVRAFVYGDESHDSTGYLTSRLITTGVNTCKGRIDPHYIIWDEPDLGLSDSYAGGVGVEIRKFVETLPELTKGVVVITHNKSLVRQLLPVNPSHLRLGGCPDLNTWLNTFSDPADISVLENRNHAMFRSIDSILRS